jgi:uncharacterized membrane protein
MLNHEIPDIDTAGLRKFGLMLGLGMVLALGLLLPWMWRWKDFPNLQWIIAGMVFVTWALVSPDSMRALYKGWMRVAMAIGDVINRIILAIVYFVVITPVGIVMRWTGKDPMCRTLDKNAVSYRVPSKVVSRVHVERPF